MRADDLSPIERSVSVSWSPDAAFRRFAGITVDVAAQLFGAGGAEHEAVRAAWLEVEVLTE